MRLLKIVCIMTLLFSYLSGFAISKNSKEIFRRIRLTGLVFDEYSISYRAKAGETTFLSPFPTINRVIGEEFFEDRLAGQVLGTRLKEFLVSRTLQWILKRAKVEYKFESKGRKYTRVKFLGKVIDEIERIRKKSPKNQTSLELIKLDAMIKGVNKFITDKAKKGRNYALDFLSKIGNDFGHALGHYLVNIRKILAKQKIPKEQIDELSTNIVLVGGVSENLGIEVTDSGGNDLLIEAVKSGVEEVLSRENVAKNIIDEIKEGIVRTTLGGKRDFYGYPAEGKDKVNVVIRAGGTKFGVGVIDRNSNVLFTKDRTWREYLAEKEVNLKNKEEVRDVLVGLVVELVNDGLKNQSKGMKDVEKIVISWAGPGEYWNNRVKAPNIRGFEGKDMGGEKDYYKLRVRLINELKEKGIVIDKDKIIIIEHDGIAAAKGEISQKGTLKGQKNALTVIWGTGIGAGVLIDREAYYDISSLRKLGIPLGEIGHHIIFGP